MGKNAFLDLIELLDEERRLNESQAFSSRDASDQARLAMAARRDVAAISNITRKLWRQGRSRRRLPSSERRLNAYIDSLLDTCFEAGITHATRAPADDTLHARPSH